VVLSVIGAGKVAWHLSKRLHACGLHVRQVYSRQLDKALQLATEVNAKGINRWEDLDATGVDLIIIAVSDQAILEVAQQLSRQLVHPPLVVHTSGSSPLSWLSEALPRSGIFYPLQSFSWGRVPDFTTIPICIETAHPEDQNFLIQLGERISHQVRLTSESDRKQLHLAAVFVNNFVNELYQIGAEILAEKRLPFELLLPLIQETAAKVQALPPDQVQTGPALRGDLSTIERQLDLLEAHPDWRELYGLMTGLIRG